METTTTSLYEYEYYYEYEDDEFLAWPAHNGTADPFKYWTLGIALNVIDAFGLLANVIVLGKHYIVLIHERPDVRPSAPSAVFVESHDCIRWWVPTAYVRPIR